MIPVAKRFFLLSPEGRVILIPVTRFFLLSPQGRVIMIPVAQRFFLLSPEGRIMMILEAQMYFLLFSEICICFVSAGVVCTMHSLVSLSSLLSLSLFYI